MDNSSPHVWDWRSVRTVASRRNAGGGGYVIERVAPGVLKKRKLK